jgi:hypothetical protein
MPSVPIAMCVIASVLVAVGDHVKHGQRWWNFRNNGAITWISPRSLDISSKGSPISRGQTACDCAGLCAGVPCGGKEIEPVLLLPIAWAASSPSGHVCLPGGRLDVLDLPGGIAPELFPLLIFVGVGAMIDFARCWRSPSWCCWRGGSVLASMAPCCWQSCWASR